MAKVFLSRSAGLSPPQCRGDALELTGDAVFATLVLEESRLEFKFQ
jgi:hypothetical protein